MNRILLFAAICGALAACSASGSQNPGSGQPSQKSEAVAAAKFESGDYMIYALRGKVKEARADYSSIVFDRGGHVAADEDFLGIGRNGWESEIARDAGGRIVSIDVDPEEKELGRFLSYNADGLLSEYRCATDESCYVKSFAYTGGKEILQEKTEYTYYFDQIGYTETAVYDIQERDSRGNWTRARCQKVRTEADGSQEKSENTITRTIEYFD